jgi:demethylmenaquinone methyltransferase / 2-methoxy-6-polyprenyl-1,4-benzoquinol methylase
MNPLPHDHIKPFDGGGEKKQQVGVMFDSIAKRYDLMNRFLSAGIDRTWRKKAIMQLKPGNPRHILDVATGTGDMAISAAKLLQPEKITGIDISPKMLEIGREKIEKQKLGTKIELLAGDGETINFADDSFDAVMVAFGVRNFQHLQKGLSEILRVMKPGARLVVLEFSKPRTPGIKNLYNLYMGVIAPRVAKLFNQDQKAYEYLSNSAKAFPDRGRFIDIMNSTGFTNCSFKSLSLGICCIYLGQKP